MSKKTKTAKCPYTDEQLSIILSAKAGRQLQPRGSYNFESNVGCLNQVAFNEPCNGRAISTDVYGESAVAVAKRFDRLDNVSKLSYERLLRFCGA